LLERLGGSKALAVLVDDIIDRLKTDMTLAMNPFLRAHLSDPKMMAVHKFSMWEVLNNATGGGNSIDHLDVGDAHKRFKISDAEWDAFIHHMKAAMDKFTVAEKEQGELLALITGYKEEIVTKPSLYERVGGAVAVSCVVDDFMNEAAKHPVILANPKVKDAFVRVPLPGLKYLITEFVCSAIGGPQKYSGSSMKSSHAQLDITDAEWQLFVDIIRSTLSKFRVPHAEVEELMNVVTSLRGDIVKPTGLARSLYDRIGGLGGLVLVCDHLADAMRNDLSLNANQTVLYAHSKLTNAGYRNVMVQALSQVLGGPHKYPKFLFDVHRNLSITEKEFNQFLFLLETSLAHSKVNNRDIVEIVNLVAGLKTQIVSN
jgi:hemoglobin